MMSIIGCYCHHTELKGTLYFYVNKMHIQEGGMQQAVNMSFKQAFQLDKNNFKFELDI